MKFADVALSPPVLWKSPAATRSPATGATAPPADNSTSTLATLGTLAAVAGTTIGAYHGYVRNGGSVGWAIAWGLLGGAFPLITVPIAVVQGVGTRKK